MKPVSCYSAVFPILFILDTYFIYSSLYSV